MRLVENKTSHFWTSLLLIRKYAILSTKATQEEHLSTKNLTILHDTFSLQRALSTYDDKITL